MKKMSTKGGSASGRNPVVHFEMPYEDPERVAKFYTSAFGWDMQYLPNMGKYVLATTSPVDKNQMHKKNLINYWRLRVAGDY